MTITQYILTGLMIGFAFGVGQMIGYYRAMRYCTKTISELTEAINGKLK